MELVDSVAAAARTFLESLDDEHASDALLPFDEKERRAWAYWPTERRGIPLWRLDRGQTKAAHRLVATLLAVPAYARAVTIMGLDEVLDRMEGYGSDRRHGDDYWISSSARLGARCGACGLKGTTSPSMPLSATARPGSLPSSSAPTLP